MKTEKQIEEMAMDMINERWTHIIIPPNENVFTHKEMILMMVKIASQAQKDLLAEASEGFEEWHKEYEKDFLHIGDQDKEHSKESWQASRLSMMKEKMNEN